LKQRFPVGLPVLITFALLYTTFFQPFYAQGAVNKLFEPTESLPIVNDPKLKVDLVFEGLHFPTSMAFLGPADILVTEKNDGTVQRLKSWKMEHIPILDVDVATRHSRGILGISIAKNNETKIAHGQDPVSGKLWDTENGPTFGDEINLVEPGFNSGWRKIQGIWKTNFETREGPEKWGIATEGSLDLVDFGGYGKYSAPEFTWNNTIAQQPSYFSLLTK